MKNPYPAIAACVAAFAAAGHFDSPALSVVAWVGCFWIARQLLKARP